MDLSRRETLLAMAAAGAWTAWPDGAIAAATGEGMYGLIGQMMAVPGKRDALVAILAEGTADMPGCISYVVALDAKDADAIWITEVWTDKASHAASLGATRRPGGDRERPAADRRLPHARRDDPRRRHA
jgi:quinol monooxygenase YgiN